MTLATLEDELVEQRRSFGAAIVEQLQSHLAAFAVDPDEAIATHRLRTYQREVALAVDVLTEIADQHVALLRIVEEPSLKRDAGHARQHHEALFASRQVHLLQTPRTSRN